MGILYLPDRYRSAWIIDGQHRLYGFSPIDDKYLDHNIVVVAFETLPKAEEANLFVTINHEQKVRPEALARRSRRRTEVGFVCSE